jgi:prepilin signal peptidase PulO-like enzyme (type II secretory pathway)
MPINPRLTNLLQTIMIEIAALALIALALALLLVLSYIDLKTYLLPNIYVFPFAVSGILFHALTDFRVVDLSQVIWGGIAGYAILYLIRAAGNRYYGQDSLGLGDVKLMGAAGLWLGVEGMLFAMTLGAFFGLLHGLALATVTKIRTGGPFTVTRLTIPAGPGFCAGIIVVGYGVLDNFILRTVQGLVY